jgi:hypothetical protein
MAGGQVGVCSGSRPSIGGDGGEVRCLPRLGIVVVLPPVIVGRLTLPMREPQPVTPRVLAPNEA